MPYCGITLEVYYRVVADTDSTCSLGLDPDPIVLFVNLNTGSERKLAHAPNLKQL